MQNEICQNEICQNEICQNEIIMQNEIWQNEIIMQNEICQNEIIMQNEIWQNEICKNEIYKYKKTHPNISKLWIDVLLQNPNDLLLEKKSKNAIDCMQRMRDLNLHEIALLLIYFKSL